MEAAIVSLINKIGNEPLAIIFLSILILRYLFIFIKDTIWPRIMKRPKKINLYEWMVEEKKEREERQKVLDQSLEEFRGNLQRIEGEIEVLSEAVTNHDELNISQSLGIFESQV